MQIKNHNFSLPTSFSSPFQFLQLNFFVHLPLHSILINVVVSSATELTFQHPILIYFMVKRTNLRSITLETPSQLFFVHFDFILRVRNPKNSNEKNYETMHENPGAAFLSLCCERY